MWSVFRYVPHWSGSKASRKKSASNETIQDQTYPIVVWNSLKIKYLVYAEFLNWPICNFPMLKLIQIERKNGNFQALNCRNLFRKVFNLLWRVMYVRHRLKKSKIVCSIQNCVQNLPFLPYFINPTVISQKWVSFFSKSQIWA